MKRVVLIVSLLLSPAIFAFFARANPPTTQPDLAAENARLRARIAELEAIIAQLKDQIAARTPSDFGASGLTLQPTIRASTTCRLLEGGVVSWRGLSIGAIPSAAGVRRYDEMPILAPVRGDLIDDRRSK
jgi:hypothetical protein